MYPHFIEVTRSKDFEDWKSLVNIDQIIFLEDYTVWVTHSDCNENPGMISVEETYEELKDLIISAGCHIEKADPRLDITHHLTMEELRNMVGEPVWNSNTNTWLLVYDGDWGYEPDPDRVCVRVVNRYGCKDIWLSEEDLIAKPLYRMKAG